MKQWQKHIDKAENFLADDHFPVSEGTLPSPLQKLKRDMEREALKRLEESARTDADFQNVVTWWNRMDDNRERKELLFGFAVLLCKTKEMALIKNQSERNIRKVKSTLFRKIHNEIMDYFITEKPAQMTPNERKFVQKNT